ncbi:hypothetical protein GIB67_022708 [Kingdonia uniflora]|uniref:Uncharacterized protein n=1 Tax=Kingdonia uniflora TaxID=39325 RepID=A0A7J7P8F0_9MAGN|nr:hypothetical protein GIB67_022708 [Kingdonia uniflora]
MIFYCIEVSGDREVQRTILEVLNQLDGFSSDDSIKVIATTNRADILDPALMRSGCLDCKIEFPHSTEEARAQILQIHSRKMNVHPNINFKELVRSTDDFNGAQLNAVCVEAGMFAPRRDATEDYIMYMGALPKREYSPLSHYHSILQQVLENRIDVSGGRTLRQMYAVVVNLQDTGIDIQLPRGSLMVKFTCNSYGERTERMVNRLAYERGTVFVKYKARFFMVIYIELRVGFLFGEMGVSPPPYWMFLYKTEVGLNAEDKAQ